MSLPEIDFDTRLGLEILMDRHGVTALVDAISQICFEKSDHVLSNWQDKALAKSWERVGQAIDASKASRRNAWLDIDNGGH